MPGNGKVFISHAHADNAQCGPLLEALKSWDVPYWFDLESQDFGQPLAWLLQTAIAERDNFLRISTPQARTSEWMRQERDFFLESLHQDLAAGRGGRRAYINVVLDGYEPDETDLEFLFVDGRGKPQAAWTDAVRRALGKPMGWQKFTDDDPGYRWWVATYPQGYVANSWRPPTADDLVVHRATCPTMTEKPPGGGGAGGTTTKICALDRAALDNWALVTFGEPALFDMGCTCMR